jgi:hypothetical protein
MSLNGEMRGPHTFPPRIAAIGMLFDHLTETLSDQDLGYLGFGATSREIWSVPGRPLVISCSRFGRAAAQVADANLRANRFSEVMVPSTQADSSGLFSEETLFQGHCVIVLGTV